jgi:hypothetical protein
VVDRPAGKRNSYQRSAFPSSRRPDLAFESLLLDRPRCLEERDRVQLLFEEEEGDVDSSSLS